MMILIAYIYTYAKNSQLYLYISLFQQTIYIGGEQDTDGFSGINHLFCKPYLSLPRQSNSRPFQHVKISINNSSDVI